MTIKQQLDALLLKFEPAIRAAFMSAIADITDNVTLQALIDAVKRRDAVAAFEVLGFTPAAMRPLTAAFEAAFEEAGSLAATGATRGKGVFRFDVRNTRAETWLRDHSSQLVTRISEDTRIAVMNTLDAGMRDGRNPRNVALDIVGRVDPGTKQRMGGVVGLSQSQEGWAASARRKLTGGVPDASYFDMGLRDKRFDRTVQAAIDAGKPLSQETVDKLMTRYRDNALKYRGEAIGRTEAVAALNRSEWEAIKQAVDAGKVSSGAVQREWDSAGDGRVRPSHRRLNGQRVGLDEPFVVPATLTTPEIRAMYPGDTSLDAPAEFTVMCRCRVRQVVDYFYDL